MKDCPTLVGDVGVLEALCNGDDCGLVWRVHARVEPDSIVEHCEHVSIKILCCGIHTVVKKLFYRWQIQNTLDYGRVVAHMRITVYDGSYQRLEADPIIAVLKLVEPYSALAQLVAQPPPFVHSNRVLLFV